MTSPSEQPAGSRYGAPMGRPSRLGGEGPWRERPILLHLNRVRLNAGGYDPGGAYWGLGKPIYEAWDDGGKAFITTRASRRDEAKADIRESLPLAKFYR